MHPKHRRLASVRKWLVRKVAVSRLSVYVGAGVLVVVGTTVGVSVTTPDLPHDRVHSPHWQRVADCYSARLGIPPPRVYMVTFHNHPYRLGLYRLDDNVILLSKPDILEQAEIMSNDWRLGIDVMAEELAHAQVERRFPLIPALSVVMTTIHHPHGDAWRAAHEVAKPVVTSCRLGVQRSLPASSLPVSTTSAS